MLFFLLLFAVGLLFASTQDMDKSSLTSWMLITQEQSKLEKWTTHFQPVLSRFEPQLLLTSANQKKVDIKVWVLSHHKRFKTSGNDGVHADMLQTDERETTYIIRRNPQDPWNKVEMLHKRKKGIIVDLPKKGDLDY